MSDNIFQDPHGILTFHDVLTQHRAGLAVYEWFLEFSGKSRNSLSYQHFMVTLKSGALNARDIRPLCRAMTECGLDPEPCIMAMYADCVPQIEPLNGSLDDEFCTVVERLGTVAAQVRSGRHLSDLARQDVVELNAVIADICAAARHMARELIAGVRDSGSPSPFTGKGVGDGASAEQEVAA